MRTRRVVALLHALGVLLFRLRLHRLVMWLSRRAPKVLLYHACEEAESDFTRDLDSNVTPARLAEQLDWVRRHYVVVPLEALHRGEVPERALVITFDDGYRSVYTGAFPALRARALPATVYLVSDVVDNGALVWVNELNWLLRRHEAVVRPLLAQWVGLDVGAPARELLGAARDRWSRQEIALHLSRLRAAAGVDGAALAREARLYLSRGEIAEMAAAGITFGNHTRTHARLSGLAEDEQRDELASGRAALAELPGWVDSAALPFGAVDVTTRRVAAESGHLSVAEVGGVNRPLVLHRLARVPVRDQGTADLFAALEVVAPVKALARRLLGRLRPADVPRHSLVRSTAR